MHQIRCAEGSSEIEPIFVFSIPLNNQRKNPLTRSLPIKLVQGRLNLLKQWEFTIDGFMDAVGLKSRVWVFEISAFADPR